ncbi:hypothetical protein OGATHE_002199 [Ogataea polymorpha]|uniref:Uncharacterized protein n=1 Tax=Ogataea polymorpha TaxID=460523 RepID=A0A9P8PJN9_9ASCO|nr:hypothetical protein OGATHE_002199 [Ogataea polymorpha]
MFALSAVEAGFLAPEKTAAQGQGNPRMALLLENYDAEAAAQIGVKCRSHAFDLKMLAIVRLVEVEEDQC